MDSVLSDEINAYKIVTLGDSGVGKTNIITRYVENRFDENSKPTIGVEYFQKDLKVSSDGEDEIIRIRIWDTAGQERFRGIAGSYYRKASGVLVIYDITNKESFLNVEKWLDEIRVYTEGEIDIILLGNKSDLIKERQVTLQEGLDLSKKKKLVFFETSALTNEDGIINSIFEELSCKIHAREKNKRINGGVYSDEKEEKTNNLSIDLTKKTQDKSGCC